MKLLFKSVLVLMLLVGQAFALEDEVTKVEASFTKKVDEVVKIVQDKSLSIEDRNDKIIETLRIIFDFELMAKLSLGKKAWMSLEKTKRVKFVNLYVRRMENSYSSKLNSYKNEVIDIEKVVQNNNRMKIFTQVRSKEEALEVIYKLYKPKRQKEAKESWLIFDVEILGISILKADKAQFKDYLKRNTIDDLMAVITKNKLEK